jgi:hypothetical protein
MYRLHIDIPMPFTESDAKSLSLSIIQMLDKEAIKAMGVDQINYRLGHDEDRQKSNYFMTNASGHVNNKKSKITLLDEESPEGKI